MAVVKMDNGVLRILLGGGMEPLELAEKREVSELPIRAQFCKPIDVDGVEYMPGVDVKDWAEEFVELGGEG